jgi:hypothetical protein
MSASDPEVAHDPECPGWRLKRRAKNDFEGRHSGAMLTLHVPLEYTLTDR